MIRKGMWCIDAKGMVGIVNAISLRGVAEFHLVDKAGVTVKIEPRVVTDLVQARLREIPESRRQLTSKQFAALGYN